MRRDWSAEELSELWTLGPAELALVGGLPDASKVGLAAQLVYWRVYGRFPDDEADLPPAAVGHLAAQLGIGADALEAYDWAGRTGRRHRRLILDYLAVADFDDSVEARFRRWLGDELLPREPSPAVLEGEVSSWFARERITRPGAWRLDRILRSARAAHDDAVLQRVADRLDAGARERLDALLTDNGEGTALVQLAADPGRIGLESLLAEIGKLERLRALALPPGLLRGLHPDLVRRFRRRAGVETAWELRRHPDRIRLPLLAFWCAPREAEVVDGLVELLIGITHRITVKAERRVLEELMEEAVEVRGKAGILFRVAEAAVWMSRGRCARGNLSRCRPGYAGGAGARGPHARNAAGPSRAHRGARLLRLLLPPHDAAAAGRARLPLQQRHTPPAARGAGAIWRAEGEGRQYFRAEEVTVEGVIRPKWRDIVIEDAPDGGQRVNRINYEICVLQTCASGCAARRSGWRAPTGSATPTRICPPISPSAGRPATSAWACPRSRGPSRRRCGRRWARRWHGSTAGMPCNPGVRLDPRRRHPILVSPLEPQPEPPNLERAQGRARPALADDGTARHPQGGRPARRLHRRFHDGRGARGDRPRRGAAPAAALPLRPRHQRRPQAARRRPARLQLQGAAAHAPALHRRRCAARATRRVVNATLAARQPQIWGEGTTACASDSKHFGAFDQNLMTEWHVRYGGRGVMIYWHVERGSVCIHSRLRRCSSSEVAAMIEGVLRHDTEMEVERQYVDSHGQSRGGIRLLPAARLSAPAAAQGHRSAAALSARAGRRVGLPEPAPVLARPIDWDLIAQQYDEMVRYATAMAERTADPETILRRFTRGNVQHPTYRGLSELGKAAKTVFLCRYLGEAALRREIHEGLNVVETWNSANDFIFFGKGGEVASNRLEDQEISVHALHLLQSCLVYVNTLMLQRVLAEPAWMARMMPADLRA